LAFVRAEHDELQGINSDPKLFQADFVTLRDASLYSIVNYAVHLRLDRSFLKTQTIDTREMIKFVERSAANEVPSELHPQPTSHTCFRKCETRHCLTSLADMKFAQSSAAKSREKLSQNLMMRSACSALVSWARAGATGGIIKFSGGWEGGRPVRCRCRDISILREKSSDTA
jgi:hypothetical protein